jgi:hypothetical protein
MVCTRRGSRRPRRILGSRRIARCLTGASSEDFWVSRDFSADTENVDDSERFDEFDVNWRSGPTPIEDSFLSQESAASEELEQEFLELEFDLESELVRVRVPNPRCSRVSTRA